MKSTHLWGAIVSLVLLGGGSAQALDRQSEAKVQQLMLPRGYADSPVYSPQASNARTQHARKLLQLWQARNKKDVTSQVIPFVRDPDRDIRESAVRILVRLRTPTAKRNAVPLLQSLLRQTRGQRTLDAIGLQLALGYVRSRDLSGQKRLDALVRSVGLSWPQVVRLSQLAGSSSAYRDSGTPGQIIIDDLLRVLTDMAKRGDNIARFDKQLRLSPAQHLLLRTASLPPARRVESILNYLSQLDVVRDDELLGRELVRDNDPQLVNALILKLRTLKKYPQRAGKRGHVPLFRTAVLTGDPRFIPIIKSFEQDTTGNGVVRYYAMQSRTLLERKMFFPVLP